VTEHDFEISAALRARRLRTRALSDNRVESEGEGTMLARHRTGSDAPAPGHEEADVVVEKRVLGDLREPDEGKG
jgi:hypothetical protein